MAEAMTESPSVGIDLGTTNSCLAIWRNGRANVLSQVKSIVSFTKTGYIVGECSPDVKNVIYDGKRLIGQNFDIAKKISNYWPFEIVDNGNQIPKYQISCEDVSLSYLIESNKI